MSDIATPYLLFLGDVASEVNAKTALGIRDWAPEQCVGEWSLPDCQVSTGLRRFSPQQAREAGAKSMLIGVAPRGGAIPGHWVPSLVEALEAGLNLVSGMHERLRDIPPVRETAARLGRSLHDVRHSDVPFQPGTGRRRPGRRVLTVGTDCALGKKYTALAITRELRRRNRKVDFRATGQTGILIAGRGVAIDAVVADFISGAAEWLAPDNDSDHWDVIEGQGSLFHPGYAGVTLGLMYGAQADALVLCHDPLRPHIHLYPDYPLPSLEEAVDLYLRVGRLTNRDVRFAGVSLNTSRLDDEQRKRAFDDVERRLGLPCCDPLREGIERVVDRLEEAPC